jgi:hypothetical protein
MVACGGGGDDDDGPNPADAGAPDAYQATYFCLVDDTLIDGGPGAPDANPCGQVVENPDDCPEGCRPVG